MSDLIRVIRTVEDFDALLRERVAILDCYATWCQPCKAFAATLRRVAEEYVGVSAGLTPSERATSWRALPGTTVGSPIAFAKLDVERYEAIAKPLRVMSLPTLFVWKNGERVKRLSGALGAKELRALIEGART